MADRFIFQFMVAGAALQVAESTLEQLDVDWAHFHATDEQLDELRNLMVTDLATYPPGVLADILATPWAYDMIRERERQAAAPAALDLLVEDDSDDEMAVEEDDDDEDDEDDEDDDMAPVSPAAPQQAIRLTAGSGSTPDLFANTSIDDSWVQPYRLYPSYSITDADDGSTAQFFLRSAIPDDGASSDEEVNNGDDAEASFEAQQLLTGDRLVLVTEEWSSGARLMEWG